MSNSLPRGPRGCQGHWGLRPSAREAQSEREPTVPASTSEHSSRRHGPSIPSPFPYPELPPFTFCNRRGLVTTPTALDDIKAMPYLRATLGESLRLYPQPPILIRRALGPDTLPPGLHGDPAGYPIDKGADLFISVWNLHRCALGGRERGMTGPQHASSCAGAGGAVGAWQARKGGGFAAHAREGALLPTRGSRCSAPGSGTVPDTARLAKAVGTFVLHSASPLPQLFVRSSCVRQLAAPVEGPRHLPPRPLL
jgi:hypothetical protein